MKTLLLHSDNVKRTFAALFDKEERISPSITAMMADEFDLDIFLHEKLEIILKENYECIFLPFTLNNEDYLQFTGLLVATHIRLTPKFRHSDVPIIFVGPDLPEHVFKLNILGSILFTPGIYFLKSQTEEEKLALEVIIKEKGRLTQESYHVFLQRIQVDPPSNYASYHSLANEWGVKRMTDIFTQDTIPGELKQQIESLDCRFETKIYFKFLEASLDKRKKIKNSERIPATISNLGKGDIVYIDDEHDKGWSILLEYLFSKSAPDLKLFTFPGFSKEDSRDDLLQKLDAFLEEDKVKKARLYIVDLRLCDADIGEKNHLNLTGLQLLKKLRKKNEGNQVVMFTASNKSWNVNAAIKAGVTAYVLKESPELSYSLDQSKLLFQELSKGIQIAYSKAYLKDFWDVIAKSRISGKGYDITENDFSKKLLEKGGWLDQIFTLLNIGDKLVYKQVLVTFTSILEAYANTAFEDGSEMAVKLRDGGRKIIKSSNGKGIFNFKYKVYPFHTEQAEEIAAVEFYDDLRTLRTDYKSAGHTKTKVKIVSTLHYNYGYDGIKMEEILELVFLRNNIAAHGSDNKVDELIRPLVLKDMTNIIGILVNMFA